MSRFEYEVTKSLIPLFEVIDEVWFSLRLLDATDLQVEKPLVSIYSSNHWQFSDPVTPSQFVFDPFDCQQDSLYFLTLPDSKGP